MAWGMGPVDAWLIITLLQKAFGGGKPASSSTPGPAAPAAATPAVVAPAPAPQVITTPATTATPPAAVIPTTPAPAATPAALPDFPGGWEPDIPPPKAVQNRAVALLPELWKSGVNTHVVESVQGRNITFQAQQMGTKKGVVAFRIKGSGAQPAGS